MKIGYHEIAFIFLLHAHIIPDCTEIISQVQEAGRPYPAHHDALLHISRIHVHKRGEDRKRGAFIDMALRGYSGGLAYFCGVKITDELLEKLAGLSGLSFDATEKEAIRSDLEKMIGFVEKINELDLSDTEPLLHISDNVNAWREDEPGNMSGREEAFKNAAMHDGKYFKVPKVINKNGSHE
jgi:aspartyl-tRNA(Asn)/glutamyl-tRNA(Gln) amidotransferase subunit C